MSGYQNTQEVVSITILTLVCVLLFSLNCLVGKFTAEEAQFRNTGHYVRYTTEYPFYCDDLSLSPDEDDETFNVKKHGFKLNLYKNRYVCKYRNLTDALEKFVERLSRIRFALGLHEQNYLRCGNDSLKEPSGHLSATFSRVSRHQTFPGRGSDLLLHWDQHPETSFVSEPLNYHRGKINVPEGRFYLLYASVLINLSSAVYQFKNEVASRFRFLLRICVNSIGYERTVLHKWQYYNTTEEHAVSSLTVGGHVLIGKDEEVYVKVSEASRIVRESAGNTFGMIPLR